MLYFKARLSAFDGNAFSKWLPGLSEAVEMWAYKMQAAKCLRQIPVLNEITFNVEIDRDAGNYSQNLRR